MVLCLCKKYIEGFDRRMNIKKIFLTFGYYIALFFISVMILCGLLVLSAKIPVSDIEKNMMTSSEYLVEHDLFDDMINNLDSSKIDRYADSILLNIAYHYDSERPLASVMESSYYYDMFEQENYNLFLSVKNGLAANKQYIRYWHGSILLVRPLMIMLNLRQIYWLNGILLLTLTAILIFLLFRKKAYAPAIGIIIGEVLTSFWFVPFSLEYTWMCLLMLIQAIVVVCLFSKKEKKDIFVTTFFLISGILTSFFDFLTTETMTLLMPLLLVIWLEKEDGKKYGKKVLKIILSWGIGYVFMWVAKWILASIVLSENVMPYVTEHISERLGGDLGISLGDSILGALFRNMGCMLPFDFGPGGAFLGIAIIIIVLYFGYVYRKEKIDKIVIWYLAIGLLPYIRYLVLHNHSYIHYFFTFRAQIATIMALTLAFAEIIDMKRFTKNRRKKHLKLSK